MSGGYYPPVGFHFRVEFSFLSSGSNDARFQEVSGITAEVSTEEITEGGENRFTHRLPLRAKYSNLVLKRGLLTDSQLINWLKNSIENIQTDPGNFDPAVVNVTLLNENHEPLGDTYSFINAWPVKWAVSDFKSQDNSLVVETIELSYNYFKKIRL
jgi:phage tail-like protein